MTNEEARLLAQQVTRRETPWASQEAAEAGIALLLMNAYRNGIRASIAKVQAVADEHGTELYGVRELRIAVGDLESLLDGEED